MIYPGAIVMNHSGMMVHLYTSRRMLYAFGVPKVWQPIVCVCGNCNWMNVARWEYMIVINVIELGNGVRTTTTTTTILLLAAETQQKLWGRRTASAFTVRVISSYIFVISGVLLSPRICKEEVSQRAVSNGCRRRRLAIASAAADAWHSF